MTPIQNPPRTRNIRPGGHIELFFALLLFALQPVFIQGQSPTPTPASVDASLFQAQSIKCEWGQGTTARSSFPETSEFWEECGDSLRFHRYAGRHGSHPRECWRWRHHRGGNTGRLDVHRKTGVGGLNFTTVFTHFVEPENVARVAVTSRHISLFGSPFPSQYHGTCVILQ